LLKCFAGTLVGVVWFRQAGATQASIFPVQGAIFVAVFNSTMDTVLTTAMELPMTRALLQREYRNGWYALPPYQMATIVVHCLLATWNSLCLSIPIYFLVGLRLDALAFLIFVSTLALLSWIGVSFGLTIGAFANDFKQAQNAVAPSLVPLILFSGYMIPYPQIPSYFRWLYDASFFQYGLAIIDINEYSSQKFNDCPPVIPASVPPTCAPYLEIAAEALCFKDGDAYLKHSHIDPADMPRNFAILGGYVLALAVISYYVTRRAVRTS